MPKSPLRNESQSNSILQQLVSFTTFIDALKKIERFKGQFYWKDYPALARYESVADHTWRVCIIILLIEKHLSQKLDLAKALKMALIHDVQEIIAGDDSPMGQDGTGKDTYAYNQTKAEERHQREAGAAKELFAKLPADQAAELYELWLEYEAQQSFTSRVVKAIDRIECMLQVLEYRDGHMFPQHLEFTIDYGMAKANVDPVVKQFGELIATEMRQKYREYKSERPAYAKAPAGGQDSKA